MSSVNIPLTADCEKTSTILFQIYKNTCKKGILFLSLTMQHPDASGQGIARNQLQVSSLEDSISQDNPVLPKCRDYRCFR
ncbi:hypothetical protein WFZ85_15370 [Flavobacterium sp. j3]|uniref:Uncharacterized protein n=1 Tax=Flavobacterium aureirubrum TaxID=3133147 RepID=A0ABU9N8H0_9FLAO